MAALLMAFKAWLDGEPEELNTDRPSEEEMHQYELAEKAHQALVSWLRRIVLHGCVKILRVSLLLLCSFMRLNNWHLDSPRPLELPRYPTIACLKHS